MNPYLEYILIPTKKFCVLGSLNEVALAEDRDNSNISRIIFYNQINCQYTRDILYYLINKRNFMAMKLYQELNNAPPTKINQSISPTIQVIDTFENYDIISKYPRSDKIKVVQLCDFENIIWDRVLEGESVYITIRIASDTYMYVTRHCNVDK